MVRTAVFYSGHLATSPELAMLTAFIPDRTTVATAVIHSGHLATPPELAMLSTILPDRTTVVTAQLSYLTEPR